MALAATLFGVACGTLAGVTAAYRRGPLDSLIMRGADVVLAFPQLVFALLLVSIVGPKLWLIVVAVGIAHTPQVARVMHSATLDISERDYVRYAQLQRIGTWKVMTREILPNLVSPLMVELGLRLTYSIVIMAGLAFVGFGQQPPAPNWGTMINENRIGLQTNALAVAVPALLIAVLTIGVSTFTDAFSRVAIGLDRAGRDSEET
jgi:peptide/nickel transport system permease protein